MIRRAPAGQPFAEIRRALAQALVEVDGDLSGSIVMHHMRCGEPPCACKTDPPVLHGPYIQWTRSVRGKTVTRFLSGEQLDAYQPWFDNARRLKDLVAKLEIASVQSFESAEGSTTTTPSSRSMLCKRPPSAA